MEHLADKAYTVVWEHYWEWTVTLFTQQQVWTTSCYEKVKLHNILGTFNYPYITMLDIQTAKTA